jgi:hypothetical protein
MALPDGITLYPRHFSVVAHMDRQYFVQLHDLPDYILASSPTPQLSARRILEEELPVIATECHPTDNSFFSNHRSRTQPLHGTQRYTDSSLEFRGVQQTNTPLEARILRFSIDFTRPPPLQISPIHQSHARHIQRSPYADVNQERVQLGATGRRAVWVERVSETDEATLMKMSSEPETGASRFNVGVLLDASELPFALGTCQSAAFDEVTGRLCLGLYDGDIYVLNF